MTEHRIHCSRCKKLLAIQESDDTIFIRHRGYAAKVYGAADITCARCGDLNRLDSKNETRRRRVGN